MFLADCSRRGGQCQFLAIFLGCSLIDMALSTADFDLSSAFSPSTDDASLWTAATGGGISALDPEEGVGFSSDLSLSGSSLTGTDDRGLFEDVDYSYMFGTDDPTSANLNPSDSQLWTTSLDPDSDLGSGGLEVASTCIGEDDSPFIQNIAKKKMRRGETNPSCTTKSPDFSNLKLPDLLPIAPPDSGSESYPERQTEFGAVSDDYKNVCQPPYGTRVCCTGPGTLWTHYMRIFEVIEGCTPCMFSFFSILIETFVIVLLFVRKPKKKIGPQLTFFLISSKRDHALSCWSIDAVLLRKTHICNCRFFLFPFSFFAPYILNLPPIHPI